jgi:hypothetical protein
MRIPEIFFGRSREVSPKMKVLAREVAASGTPSRLDFGPTIDVRAVGEAAILLEPNKYFDKSGRQFHSYAFFSAVAMLYAEGKLSEAVLDESFSWSLLEPWRFLGVVGATVGAFFSLSTQKAGWRAPYLRSALQSWDTLDEVGARYAAIGAALVPFWQVPNSIHIALRLEGFPMDPNPTSTPERTRELLVQWLSRSSTRPVIETS